MDTSIDFSAIKNRQQIAWARGDYAGRCRVSASRSPRLATCAGTSVCSMVAAGNGNTRLAAARRGRRATSTDYVAALLGRGAERVRAERLDIVVQTRDAQVRSFGAASFDAVLSTFGVMFAPDQRGSAADASPVTTRRPRELATRSGDRP